MDAISFVLGESSKNLRVKRLGVIFTLNIFRKFYYFFKDLVHGASISQPQASNCSVRMIYQYDDEEKTTKVFQRNLHEFRVDDQKVSLSDYHKALEGINIFIKVK